MAMSFGQEKAHGHSDGPIGHGGHHTAPAAVSYKGKGNETSHLTHGFIKGKHSSTNTQEGDGPLTHMPNHGGDFGMGTS